MPRPAPGDDSGVEAEPVHAPDVAGVLYLETPVHDDIEAAGPGYLGGFVADDPELEPQGPGVDGDGLLGDLYGGGGISENVDDVHGAWDVRQ